MAVCSRIRQHHPATRVAQTDPTPEVAPVPRRGRGRPRGSRTAVRPVKVRHEVFLGVRHADCADIPPEFWNLLCSLTAALFRGLARLARKLKVEAPGHEQEHVLFRELPRLLLTVVLDVATWWWSFDRGFLGSSLRCPKCGAFLAYKGDVDKEMVTPFGVIRPRRAYYRCPREECDTSVWPLDERLGLDGNGFLPSVQEIVVWLTSLDPYGKCLEFVAKLLHFSISHRSAWLITQKYGRRVKEREDEGIEQAFDDPADPVFPAAELPPPAVGVVMFDGTCGRIDKDEEPQPVESNDEDPDAPSKPPDFREVKLGLAGHLVPPARRSGKKSGFPEGDPASAPLDAPTASNSSPRNSNKKRRRRKVRPLGEEPTIAHKKLAVHLGSPLRLFQLMLILIHRLGLDRGRVLLVIGDGAKWIWCGVREHLSSLGLEVVEILDFYHATEHLWKLANAYFGQGTREAVAWARASEADLLHGRIAELFKNLEAVLEHARQSVDAASTNAAEKLVTLAEKEIAYFRNNIGRINYADYLSKGYLIGSGAMEGSCRHHVKERIDRGGMHWSASGAMAVLRNRTLIKNGDWEDFWNDEAQRGWRRYERLTATLTA